MVSLSEVQSSNARISSALQPGLVAVFVGGTNGIGETTLREFARHVRKPRIYFTGRSQEAGDRIASECKIINPEGDYIFMKADTSLICNVDALCKEIKTKEQAINLLFLSTGTLATYTKTSEDLHLAVSLVTYSRNRFVLNLLPLLQAAPSLRRIVTVFAGTKEGLIDTSDFQGLNIPMLSARGHSSSLVTLSLEALAKQAPEVSFIHDFPGPVKSGIGREGKGVAMGILIAVFTVFGPLVNMPVKESGERHLYLATSARYPPAAGMSETSGVSVEAQDAVAEGTNGVEGSGVYSVDSVGSSAGPKVVALLAKMRKEGIAEKFWQDQEEQFKRIMAGHVA